MKLKNVRELLTGAKYASARRSFVAGVAVFGACYGVAYVMCDILEAYHAGVRASMMAGVWYVAVMNGVFEWLSQPPKSTN